MKKFVFKAVGCSLPLMMILAAATDVNAAQTKTESPKQESVVAAVKNITPFDHTNAVMKEARTWLGTRYVYGAASRRATDCSGFTMSVFRNACDFSLPRSAAGQAAFCKKIKKSEMRPGDLIFFHGTNRRKRGVTHVGMYIGDGKFIHASSRRGVVVSGVEENYYSRHFHSAGRVEGIFGADRNDESQDYVDLTEMIVKSDKKYVDKTKKSSIKKAKRSRTSSEDNERVNEMESLILEVEESLN